jgi:hypothetical protein
MTEETQGSTEAQITEESGTAKLISNPHPVEEIYVDGFTGLFGRGGVVKIECYRVVGLDRDDKAELRRVTHRLVLPTSAVGELVKVVQGVVQAADAKKKE